MTIEDHASAHDHRTDHQFPLVDSFGYAYRLWCAQRYYESKNGAQRHAIIIDRDPEGVYVTKLGWAQP